MNLGLLTILLFGTFIVCLISGFPVAFALGGVSFLYAIFLWGSQSVMMSAYSTLDVMANFIMVAIPLFVLMGNILGKSGVAENLFKTLYLWLGPIRGGLAITVVLVGALMAAMVGVIGASIFTIGIIAIPAMQQRGYDKHMIMGPLMSGCALAQLIPPSTLMLAYAAVTELSAGRMFIGGIMPGLLLAGLYSTFIAIRVGLKPELGPPIPVEDRVNLWQKVVSLKATILPIFIIVGVLGSIFAGVATPTEAASVGVIGAFICAAINRRLTWGVIKESLYNTLRITGMIIWIVLGAHIFSRFYIAMGAAHLIEETVVRLAINPWWVIIGMQVILIILGMLLEDMGIIMITAPIFNPIVIALGFDPLWFSIVFMINLQISQLTPPFGFSLFYGKALMPEESMGMLWRSIIPFVPLQTIGLVTCMIFPKIITWLPTLMFALRG